MVKIGLKEAKKFMDEISSDDNVAIITDQDPDGFCSGILFYDLCRKKGAKVSQFTFVRGFSSDEDFKLDDFNKIITTDLPASQVGGTLKKFKSKKILFMDHHPKDDDLPKSVLVYRTLDRGYIPSSRSAYELTGGKKWIALVGTLSDAAQFYHENDEFIKGSLDEVGMNLDEFNKKVVFTVGNFLIYFMKDGKKVFDVLKNIDSIDGLSFIKKYSDEVEIEVERIVKEFEEKKEVIEGVDFYYIDSKFQVKGAASLAIVTKKNNKDRVIIFVSPKGKDKISLSARNQSRKRDMAQVLKAGIGKLEGSSGGHFAASGGTIEKKDLDKFKENLRDYLKKNPFS